MRKGYVDRISEDFVAGWAADTEEPNKAIDVDIFVADQFLQRVTADQFRQDLAAVGEFGGGNHGFRCNLAKRVAADTLYLLNVRFADVGTLIPGGNTGQLTAPRVCGSYNRTLAPILITGPGRSGTTLHMAVLGNSPQIVIADLVPYEVRLMSYYATAHRVLTHVADLARSTHPDDLEGDGFRIGFNPYNSPEFGGAFKDRGFGLDYTERYVPEKLDRLFSEVIVEYYLRLAQDCIKPGAIFFAEKNNSLQDDVRSFLRRSYAGAREIFTVRDPRDVLCSHISYFGIDIDRAFDEISSAANIFLELRAENASDTHFSKYESLIEGNRGSFLSLSDFLGVEVAPPTNESAVRLFMRHGTSADPRASVGRWRAELSKEWQHRCSVAWGKFLTAFDYPV
jgi:hypothetical protein